MRLEQIGEFGLIARLKEKIGRKGHGVVTAIGDDAAAVRISPDFLVLLTADVLVERVHFDRRIHSMWQIGWRTAVANVSDIAAMGGLPRYALVSICLPEVISVEQVEELYGGMKAVGDEHHFEIVGGDTVSSPHDLVISFSLFGEVEEDCLVSRGGARVGDLICVTGELGGSQAGLALLQQALSSKRGTRKRLLENRWPLVCDRHLRPQPRLAEGRLLAQERVVHAMIDISDGLAADVGHIARESGVGAEIIEDRIPIGSQTRLAARHLGVSSRDLALHGGEDFELAFTISSEDAPGVVESVRQRTGIAVSIIGKVITAPQGLVLISASGKRHPLLAEGYRHF